MQSDSTHDGLWPQVQGIFLPILLFDSAMSINFHIFKVRQSPPLPSSETISHGRHREDPKGGADDSKYPGPTPGL